MKASVQFGPNDPAVPLVLEVAVADRGGLCAFGRQASIGYSPKRLLGFWRQALPSSTANYFHFERQFLA